MKKRKIKNSIIAAILILILAVICIKCLRFESVSEYNNSDVNKGKIIGNVTLSVDCSTILSNYDNLDSKLKSKKYVPDNGIIFSEKKCELRKGDTAFDILQRNLKDKKIQMDYSGSRKSKNIYVKGINYIYEFSCGKLSGWMYKVNGEFTGNGCSEKKLADGDKIEFVYTCDLGRDVGNDREEGIGK